MGDDLWLYFEDMGHSQAQCKHCQKSYSFKTNTTSLRNHLERNHGGTQSSSSSATTTTPSTPRQLNVTSTTLATDEILSKDRNPGTVWNKTYFDEIFPDYSSALKSLDTLSEQEHSDTDTQNK